MKKHFILSILLSSLLLSCNEEPEPEPEVIRAYCHLYHFIPEIRSVTWVADDTEVPEEKVYAYQFAGAVILESESEQFPFAVKNSATGELLASAIFQLEKNKFYSVFACGPAEEPILFCSEIETTFPPGGNVKLQVLHSINGQGPIDLYIGDTTLEKRSVTALDHLELTDPFEVADFDIRLKMIVTAHSDEFNPDNVLLTSDFNEITSEANYLTVVAPHTYDTTSKLTFWLYDLPMQ